MRARQTSTKLCYRILSNLVDYKICREKKWKEKTESHKLLSAWGTLAKMAANGIRAHARTHRRRSLRGKDGGLVPPPNNFPWGDQKINVPPSPVIELLWKLVIKLLVNLNVIVIPVTSCESKKFGLMNVYGSLK